MIELKIINKNEEKVFDISKENHFIILDNKKFLNFYNNFYKLFVEKNKDFCIYLNKEKLDSKNTRFLDFSSYYNLCDSLILKKDSLMYNYIFSKYSLINSNHYLDFKDILDNFIKEINTELDDEIFSFESADDFDKIFYIGLIPKIKNNNELYIFDKLLKKYLDNNKGKKIIFIDSSIYNFDFSKYDDIFVFDISKIIEIKNINFIQSDDLHEFNFERLLDFIYKNYPKNYNEEKVIECLINIFDNDIYKRSILIDSELKYILISLIFKYYNFKKELVKKCIINENIESFLTNL